ncbi:GSU3529 family protein [Geoalkalibacter sp.]|uniref:GSU3529 family protein n=1 Tax=Geoalkalibacter sp. TaxID=3041440 RepID=UPI00272DE45A|nr:hypothetical protein [Geoalkalibacter sp.]
MDLMARLLLAVERAQAQNDLPDAFARRIARLAADPKSRALKAADLEDLIDKLGDYDTYGQTGYLGMGVNNVILERTLERLEARSRVPH